MDKLKICLVVLGLGLYLLDVSLHLSIASKYLTMQGCFRSVSHQFNNFKLEDLIDLDVQSLASNNIRGQNDEVKVNSGLSAKLTDFLDDNLYLKLRNHFIRILPQHWIDRIVKMITFQAGRYRGSDISKMCRLNGNQFQSLAEMAIYVCDQALEAVPQQKNRAAKALNSFFQDDSTEDAIVEALVTNDLRKIMDILVTDILANGDTKSAKKLQEIFQKISTTFSDPEEISAIMNFLGEPAVQNNLGSLMSTLSGIEPETLESAAKTFGKIEPGNMPKIDSLLKQLNVTLASFISDPGILFKFFGDPEKAKIMMEVQKLLPLFTPEDLEAVLTIKIKFDEIPQADEIFGQILALPGQVLTKMFQLNLDSEELDILKLAADKLMANEDTLSLIKTTQDLDLLSSTGRSKFVSQCRHKSLHIECIDETVDLCSNGHYHYGLAVLGICAVPGILFAVSDYINYRGFTFGKLLGNPILRNWPAIFKLILLPIYAAFMAPFIVLVTLYSYLKALRSLIKTNTVNINGNQLDDIKRLRREKEFHATKFHSLESHGQSFLQIILQTYLLFLLLILGTGTVIAGVDTETFFKSVFPLTVSSILISLINFIRTSWSLQAKDHLAKEELEGSPIKTELKSFKQGTQILTHILWSFWTVIFFGGSIVLLSLLGYVEMFSNELLSESGSSPINIHLLPFLVLCSSIPINLILYKVFINNKDSFSFAHAILSSVLPLRYLHYDNSARTKKYLLGNQITQWLSHILAWLAYSVAIYVNYNHEDTGLSRLFPVLATLCTIPPLFGAIHWAVAIQPSYEEDQKTPDDLSVLSLKGQTCKLQISWQFCTSLTRITSVALLAYVHYEHWVEVEHSAFKLAVAETVPFLVLLLIGNIALQFVHRFGTVLEGLIGMLMPNGYLKAQLQIREDKSAVQLASRYIVANVVWNAILHILLWLVLAFYCWECTKVLSLTKLIYCFPIAMAVWLINFFFTIYVWKKSIRPILDTPMEHAMDQNEVPENWTSAKVYSTQL